MKRVILLCSFILVSLGAWAQTGEKDSVDLLAPPKEVVVEEKQTPVEEDLAPHLDKFPTFPGGAKAYNDFVTKNTFYPMEARDNGKEGTVYISMIVDEEGNHYSEKVLNNVDALLAKEALRVIKSMPKWEPGEFESKPVKAKVNVKVEFHLK